MPTSFVTQQLSRSLGFDYNRRKLKINYPKSNPTIRPIIVETPIIPEEDFLIYSLGYNNQYGSNQWFSVIDDNDKYWFDDNSEFSDYIVYYTLDGSDPKTSGTRYVYDSPLSGFSSGIIDDFYPPYFDTVLNFNPFDTNSWVLSSQTRVLIPESTIDPNISNYTGPGIIAVMYDPISEKYSKSLKYLPLYPYTFSSPNDPDYPFLGEYVAVTPTFKIYPKFDYTPNDLIQSWQLSINDEMFGICTKYTTDNTDPLTSNSALSAYGAIRYNTSVDDNFIDIRNNVPCKLKYRFINTEYGTSSELGINDYTDLRINYLTPTGSMGNGNGPISFNKYDTQGVFLSSDSYAYHIALTTNIREITDYVILYTVDGSDPHIDNVPSGSTLSAFDTRHLENSYIIESEDNEENSFYSIGTGNLIDHTNRTLKVVIYLPHSNTYGPIKETTIENPFGS